MKEDGEGRMKETRRERRREEGRLRKEKKEG
jgi:hypothetical protein